MNTQTSLVVEQIRLQQWADQIRDCQNRSSDMKVDAWCREHISRYLLWIVYIIIIKIGQKIKRNH